MVDLLTNARKTLHLLSLHLCFWFNKCSTCFRCFFSYFHKHFQEKEAPKSVDICLRERNNMEPNKSLIKLIAIIYLSFPWSLNVPLPVANVWTYVWILRFIGFSNLVLFSMHSSKNLSRASRPILSTFNRNDATSSFVLLPDLIQINNFFRYCMKRGSLLV